LAWLGGIIGGSVLLGGLIAPAIATWLLSWPAELHVGPWTLNVPEYVAKKGYPSVFSRVVMVLATAGIVVFRRRFDLGGWWWGAASAAGDLKRVGLYWRPGVFHGVDFLAGLAIAGAVIGGALWLKFAVGEFVWSPDPPSELAVRLSKTAVGMLLIALIEQVVFRGLLLGGLARKYGLPAAVVLSNLIFAAAHSVRQVQNRFACEGPLDVAASLRCVGEFLGGWTADPAEAGRTFLSLLAFGLLTTYAAVRRRTLYLAMGLHAATAFFVQVQGSLRARELGEAFDSAGWAWLMGGRDLKTGLIALLAMGVAWALTAAWCRSRPAPPEDSDGIFGAPRADGKPGPA
jgi:membrane protease YdiL (CAAX protease family)